MALLRLKKLYRAAGLPMQSAELPDHLTVMPAFAALAPPGHGEALLAEHRPAIELLRLSLHDLDSPYAHVLDALAAGLPALGVTERGEVARLAREGPPEEAVGLEPYGPPGGDPDRSADMSAGEILLWIIFPYAAVTTFIVGTWWRYRADQFGWTSGSTQIFEQKILGWAGPAFHYGALMAVGGHVIGLMVPKSFTAPVGMSEHTYRWFSAIAGAVAGAICVAGFVGLVYRRISNVRVRRTTSRTDLLVYFLLVVLIGLGCWMTFAHNLITASPYDYRDSVSEWWRSLFILQPDVEAVQGANTVYQVHAIIAWAFWAMFPFSRLVHAWSIPLQYLGRPYILYRRRYPERAR
jgi:nitrate reductase gamma subunit